MKMDTCALVLAIIGALNWGCIGLFGVDLLGSMFGGEAGAASRVAYTLIGLGGLWCITLLFRETEHTPIADVSGRQL